AAAEVPGPVARAGQALEGQLVPELVHKADEACCVVGLYHVEALPGLSPAADGILRALREKRREPQQRGETAPVKAALTLLPVHEAVQPAEIAQKLPARRVRAEGRAAAARIRDGLIEALEVELPALAEVGLRAREGTERHAHGQLVEPARVLRERLKEGRVELAPRPGGVDERPE